MITKLRQNYLLTSMALISLVVALMLTAIYSVTYARVESENRAKLRALPLSVTYSELPKLDPDSLLTMPPIRITSDYALSFLVVMDRDGVIERVESHIDMPDADYDSIAHRAWEEQKNDSAILHAGRIWKYTVAQLKESHVYLVDGQPQEMESGHARYGILFLDVTDSTKGLQNLLITLIAVFVLSLGLVYGISALFAHRAVKPISEAWTAQQQFIADASHELRTPLAIIHANADALQSDLEDDNRWLNNIRQESSRMARLTDGLLNLIKTQDTSTRPELEMFPISDLIRSMSQSVAPLIADKGLVFTQHIDEGINVTSTQEAVEQIVSILLDNAVKYTAGGGEIIVSLSKGKSTTYLEVSNTADIAPDQLLHIFDRFYRADAARSGGGYGLGLAIAKALSNRIGAALTVRSADAMTTFTLSL